MQVEVERRSGSQVTLTVTVEAERVRERIEQLFQKYARRVSVPGFRPGKAPRSMVESRIDRKALMQDAIDDLINDTFKEALLEEHLEPLERGEVKDAQMAEDSSLTYQVELTVRPEVKLSDYKELVVRHTATPVTDELVESQIERLRESGATFAEITDNGIEQNDLVTIDYTMRVDGELYPEGGATGYPLQVGSDTFFPELNEALPGLKTGDTTTISVSYPEAYSTPELAGKTATFEIVICGVRRRMLPELDVAWVTAISEGDLQTVDELCAQVRKRLEQDAERMDRDHVRSEILSQLVAKSELDVPAALAEEQYGHLMEDLEHQLAHEHMSMEDYARSLSKTVVDVENEQQIFARDIVRRTMIMQEIARRENLYVTDEEIDSMVMVWNFNQDGQSVEKLKRDLPRLRKEMDKSGELQSLVSRLWREKVLSFLEEHADVEIEGRPRKTEEAGEPEETEQAVKAVEPEETEQAVKAVVPEETEQGERTKDPGKTGKARRAKENRQAGKIRKSKETGLAEETASAEAPAAEEPAADDEAASS